MAEKLIAEILIRAGVEGIDKAIANLHATEEALQKTGVATQVTDRAFAAAEGTIGKLSRAYVDGYGANVRFNQAIDGLGSALKANNAYADQAGVIYQGLVNKLGQAITGTEALERGYNGLALVIDSVNNKLMTQAEVMERAASVSRNLATAQQTNKEIQTSTGLGVGPGERRGTGTSTSSLLSGQYGARESADVFSAAFEQDAQKAGQALEQYEREQKALTVKYEARQRELAKEVGTKLAQEFQQGLNDGLRIGASALDAGAGFAALDRYFEQQQRLTVQYETEQRELAETVGRKLAAEFQQGLNKGLRVNAAPATENGAGFGALERYFEEQQRLTVRYETEQRERAEKTGRELAKQFQEGLNAGLRVNTSALENGASYTALERYLDEQERLTVQYEIRERALAEKTGQKLADAFQTGLNEGLRVGAAPAIENGASYAALERYIEEQERLTIRYEAEQRRVAEESGRKLAQEFQAGINAGLRVGVSAIDAGAGFGALEKYFEEQARLTTRYEVEQRERAAQIGQKLAQEFQKGINDGLRIGVSALDAGAGSSALEQYFARQEQLTTKYEAQQREEGQRAAQAFAKGYQEALNARLSVNMPSATSQGAGFETLAADMERAAQKAKDVKAAIDPLAAAQERLNEKIREYGTLAQKGLLTEGEHAKAVAKARGEFATYANQLRIASTEASALEKATGLTGRSLLNLQYQLNDIVSGLIMGQSPFMIMTQQSGQVYQVLGEGQGGVSGTLGKIKNSILGISPAAIAGFGAAGLLGALGAASIGLAKMRDDLDRTQAKLRALTTPQDANNIIAGGKSATQGTPLEGPDTYGLGKLARQQAQPLGLINGDPNALVQSAVRLSSQLNATQEEAKGALTALEKLLGQEIITAEQGIKVATDFPQLAGVIAKTFGVTADQLDSLDPKIGRVRGQLAGSIEEMGKQEGSARTLSTAWSDLKKSVGEAADEFDRATGLSSSFKAFLTSTARDVDNLAAAIRSIPGAIQAVRSALSSTSNPSPTDPRDNGFPGMPGQVAQPGGPFPRLPSVPDVGAPTINPPVTATIPAEQLQPVADKIGDKISQTLPPALVDANQSTVNEIKNVAAFGEKGLKATYATNDGVSRVYDASKMGVDSTKAADTANRQGLSGVENAVRNLRINTGGGGGGSPVANVSRKDGGGPTLNVDGLDKAAIEQAAFELSGPAWMYPGNNSYVANNTISASNMPGSTGGTNSVSFALPKGTRLGGNGLNGYHLGPADLNSVVAPLKAWAETHDKTKQLSPEAQAANENTVQTSIGNPVGDAIQRLQGQQDAVMGRQYTPDAYTDKNPDQFYSGGKIFTEQQDKQFTALQKQIDHLVSLRAMAEAQLKATQSLPQSLADALVSALVKAGLSGDQIAAAMAGLKPTTTGTSQPGYLANANGATRTRMTIGA